MSESFLNGRVSLHAGDSREVLKTLADNSMDSIVTDPPYALVSIGKRDGKSNMEQPADKDLSKVNAGSYRRLARGFMGQKWDTGETAFAVEFWQECLRVLKPGGHVIAFSGTRTFHRMAVAIEDAGFEIRDQIGWTFGSGFPKSHDVSKGIDRAAGAERERILVPTKIGNLREQAGPIALGASGFTDISEPVTDSAIQWQGWGTALKPAWEPICLARKPLSEKTVAANVLRWGTGAINVDGCRVAHETVNGGNLADNPHLRDSHKSYSHFMQDGGGRSDYKPSGSGRFPANVIHDGSDEVIAAFPSVDTQRSTVTSTPELVYGGGAGLPSHTGTYGADESGSAARFFYTAKADADDRLGSKHPTVKPVDLMQWLCRLVTPKNGTVLDPFAGTGTTGEAAFREGFNAVLIEREQEYQADIRRRMALVMSGPDERKRESIKAKLGDVPFEPGSLFADVAPPCDRRENTAGTRASSSSALRPNHRTDRIEMVNE